MMPDTELLQYIHKTADMGCEGIQAVVGYVEQDTLKNVLNEQLSEYQALRKQAAALLNARGEIPNGVGTMAKVSSDLMSAGKLMMDHSPSKIAEMTIQGNNMGVSKTIQHLHDYQGGDEAVQNLARKLLSTEEANVEQLKAFL